MEFLSETPLVWLNVCMQSQHGYDDWWFHFSIRLLKQVFGVRVYNFFLIMWKGCVKHWSSCFYRTNYNVILGNHLCIQTMVFFMVFTSTQDIKNLSNQLYALVEKPAQLLIELCLFYTGKVCFEVSNYWYIAQTGN